jgi:hypothetical protein
MAALIASATAFAAKPSSSSPTLSVSFSGPAGASASTPADTPYLVSGCGYGTTGVTVVVHSPTAYAFAGQMPDANGCISLSNFATQGSGHYQVDAWQDLRNKSTNVASTSFDLG